MQSKPNACCPSCGVGMTGSVMSAVSTIVANTAGPLLNDLSELLTSHVQERPERTAVGTSDRRTVISYGQLDCLVRSAMAQLCELGLSRGATVALVSDNCVEFVVGFLAIVSSGARIALLNPALTSSELSRRLSQLSAHAVLVPQHLANKLEFADAIAAAEAADSEAVDLYGFTSGIPNLLAALLSRAIPSGPNGRCEARAEMGSLIGCAA